MAGNSSAAKSVKAETEIVMDLVGVKYHDPESQFSILNTSAGICCGLVAESYLSVHATYRLFGRWDVHPKFGRQFKFETISRDTPLTEWGVIQYLTEHCNGVGHTKARKLWSLFGADAIRVLREEPGRVPEDVLSAEQAELISQSLTENHLHEHTKAQLYAMLKQRGFGRKIYEKLLILWGAKAPENVRRNPFALQSYRMPGAGFKRCDKLWVDLGKPRDALKRQLLGLCASITTDREGSTWFRGESVCERIQEQVSNGNARPVEALKLGLRARRLAKLRDGEGQLWITLRERAAAEERVARALVRLRATSPQWPTDIPVSQAEGDGLPSLHQVDELRKAFAGPVGCFTGGPGSGKTFTLSFALRAILQQFRGSVVKVAAPTGKAAVRATESLTSRSIPIRAQTIHQLLEIGRNGHDGDGWGFQRNATNPLECQWLIVDESSMIDLPLMADLLQACPTGCHVLFVGDTHQLPPVGHGAPLRDLIAAGVPTGQLTEIRRNAGSIVTICAAIKSGEKIALPNKLDLESESKVNVKLIASVTAEQTVDNLLAVLANLKKWHPVWETQVIVARNDKSVVARKQLNQRLRLALNPDGKNNDRNPYWVGDKVICLKNNFAQGCEFEPGFRESDAAETDAKRYFEDGDELVYLANGEIGRVVAIDEQYAVVDFKQSKWDTRPLIKIRVKAIKQNVDDEAESEGSDYDLAYAITVHKAQGSESPCVIVVCDDGAFGVAGREWWYTAISRASQACLILGTYATVERQAKVTRLSGRKTFLAELIRGEIGLPDVAEDEREKEKEPEEPKEQQQPEQPATEPATEPGQEKEQKEPAGEWPTLQWLRSPGGRRWVTRDLEVEVAYICSRRDGDYYAWSSGGKSGKSMTLASAMEAATRIRLSLPESQDEDEQGAVVRFDADVIYVSIPTDNCKGVSG